MEEESREGEALPVVATATTAQESSCAAAEEDATPTPNASRPASSEESEEDEGTGKRKRPKSTRRPAPTKYYEAPSAEKFRPKREPATVSVEHPCFARSHESLATMLDMLGDLNDLGDVMTRKGKFIDLRLRPNDAAATSVVGETKHRRALVVRIPRYAPGDSATERKAEPVRVVDSVFRFRAMCDYQFLPQYPSHEEVVVADLKEIGDSCVAVRSTTSEHIVPVQFSQQDAPFLSPSPEKS